MTANDLFLRTPAPPDATGDALTPWERRDQIGAVRGLFATLTRAAFSPSTFFGGLRPDAPWKDAFWYGWLVQALLGALGAVLYLVPILSLHGGALPAPGQLGLYLLLPLAPVVLYPLLVLVLAGAAHLLALVAGGAHRGFGATVRAVCYSGAAVVFLVSLGPLALWALVIAVYALARLQRTTVPRAAFAVIGAVLLLAIAIIVPLGIQLARSLP